MSPRPVDPEIGAALGELAPGAAALDASTLPAARAQRRALLADIELSDAVERVDHVVPAADGAPEIRVRVHTPSGGGGPRPCIYSMHGGGYVLGSPEMDDVRFDRWCPQLGVVGVSVDYRLSPETPHPGPLDDCYRGLRWVAAHADDLGVDPGRLGISGASAGGGLAAALALLARDRAEVDLAFQLLIYPMIDDRQETASSRLEEVPIWGPATNEFGWRSYLGDLYGSDGVPGYAAPARATDLAGLPPALVLVGTLDGFCDEDISYAQRLVAADVPTELHVYPGAPHGFDGFFPATTLARRARRDTEEWLAAQLR